MSALERIDVPGLVWQPGRQARVWFIQPRLALPREPPFVCQHEGSGVPGIQLLQAALRREAQMAAIEGAPTLILLPEFSLRPDEIEEARQLVREARPNTLIVFGCGQQTEEQVKRIEPTAQLWEGPSEGHFTNCAAIGLGGSDKLFLQPKIIPSRWEQDSHWRGRVIRYFVGQYVQFVVLICSEFLGRPEGRTTVSEIIGELRRKGASLNLLFWLQHNRDPRSEEFKQSIRELRHFRPTVLVISSRGDRPNRLANYGVSGAIVPQYALPRQFRNLDKRSRYVEPADDDLGLSRIVLARYDADAYRVLTVVAEALANDEGASKGALFEEAQPYRLREGALEPSDEHIHLADVSQLAAERAGATYEALGPEIERIRGRLLSLSTADFLGFLDVGVLPRPRPEAVRHAAAQQHPEGDFRCRCWTHRECLDNLSADIDAAGPLAHVLGAAAALERHGLPTTPTYNPDRRTNFITTINDASIPLGIVFPHNFDAEESHRGLCGSRELKVLASPYIILGARERRTRPSVRRIDAGRAKPIGSLRAGNPEPPALRTIYWNEFWQAAEEGRLRELFAERLVRAEA